MTKIKIPRLAYNWISALGMAMALISALTLMLLLAAGMFIETGSNPYFGIFLYMILPGIMITGLLLVPLGMWRMSRIWKREGTAPATRFPVLDLNNPRQRQAVLIFSISTLVFLVLSAMGSYGAYHHSESVEFCGVTCHEVMEPEYTTYQNSPHARVACAQCHVGAGAGWYVKSKLSGAYQIYSVAADKYPRPIPTPVKSLRPAQQTCEQCHWPQHIYGAVTRQFNHYMYDDANTHWPINMLIKVGGGDPATGQTAGIHWHMNIGVQVEYIARDEERQKIPWVRVTDKKTGRVTVYKDSTDPITDADVAAAEPRKMDCMDCHNRPSHIFRSPEVAINEAILKREIDAAIPGIKAAAVEAMATEYATKEEAMRGIANRITDGYRKNRPDDYAKYQVAIDQAVVATQNAYGQNIFPAMKATWAAYPVNIGHFTSPGCMRCHDGNHTTEAGVSLTRECTACHTILTQGSGDRAAVAATQDGLPFEHPEDIGDEWQSTGCYECHTGVKP